MDERQRTWASFTCGYRGTFTTHCAAPQTLAAQNYPSLADIAAE